MIVLVNCFFFFLLHPAQAGDENERPRVVPVLKDLWHLFSRPETFMSVRLASDNADGLCGPVPEGFEWLLHIAIYL